MSVPACARLGHRSTPWQKIWASYKLRIPAVSVVSRLLVPRRTTVFRPARGRSPGALRTHLPGPMTPTLSVWDKNGATCRLTALRTALPDTLCLTLCRHQPALGLTSRWQHHPLPLSCLHLPPRRRCSGRAVAAAAPAGAAVLVPVAAAVGGPRRGQPRWVRLLRRLLVARSVPGSRAPTTSSARNAPTVPSNR
jgi:hypothetical protein